MKRILLEISPELSAAIDAARGARKRNPAIEHWLWRVADVKRAAAMLGVRKPERPRVGRPRNVGEA